MDAVIKLTCYACPVQYEGTVDGIPFYFRIRHGEFQFAVHETDPVGASLGFVDGYVVTGDSDIWAVCPESDELLQKCLEEWSKSKAA